MDRPDTIADDPPSICEAKKRVTALGLTGPRTCGRCGQLRKGRILYGYTDYFLCFNCLVKDEAKGISETEEFTRMDRVWKIRIARKIWEDKNAAKSKCEAAEMLKMSYMSEYDRAAIARKFLDTLDLPVNDT
jgi:hypothetical protein